MSLPVGNFSHNFCESKVFPDQPELFNAFSSLAITLMPFFFKMPKVMFLHRIIIMLILNGFGSFYYHYYLSWFGKHLDELTMIFAAYTGITGIIKILDIDKRNHLIAIDTYTMFMIIINTIPKHNGAFAFLYFIYIDFLLYYIYLLKIKIPDLNIHPLQLSFYGFISWTVSEILCNRYLYYGHSIWHILFPLGFIKFIDNLNNSLLDFSRLSL